MEATIPVLDDAMLSAPAAVIEEILHIVCDGEHADSHEDILHHLCSLGTAFQMNNEEFFLKYALWLNNLLSRRGVKTAQITDSFLRLDAALQGRWTASEAESFHRMLQQAVQALHA